MAEWKLKVLNPCTSCGGVGTYEEDLEEPIVCTVCNGAGKIRGEVEPLEIKKFLSTRTESIDFVCVGCGAKETILRPRLKQIPHGWINWDSTLVCGKCKVKVIYTAVMAVNQKIQQFKDKKGTD